MASPLSSDLRARVVNAVEEGSSRRQAAKRFEVSTSSAIRWRKNLEQVGRVEASRKAATGGRTASRRMRT